MSFLVDTKAAWKESLSYCTRAELKTLALVTLNTFRRSGLLLISNFWWLFILLGAGLSITFLFETLQTKSVFLKGLTVGFMLLNPLVYSFLLFFCFLAIRASTERKDAAYFSLYLPRFFEFLFLILLSRLVFQNTPPLNFFLNFSILFFLDAQYTLNSVFISLLNGIKMIWYFLPFFVLFPVLWLIITSVPEAFFMAWMQPIITTLPGFLLIVFTKMLISLLVLSLCSALYTKIKHSNYRLFFKT